MGCKQGAEEPSRSRLRQPRCCRHGFFMLRMVSPGVQSRPVGQHYSQHKEAKMSAPQPALSPEYAVAMRESILEGIERELQITKKVVAAIPEDKKGYRPDPKARSAWDLAWHLASSDVQMTDEVADLKFTMEPRFKDEPKTVAALVDWYDANFQRAIARVRALTPEQLCTPVDFYGVLNLPVVSYLSFVNNHSIHHRGQLSTYLRPMGSKVPGIYGGSADEPWPG